MLLMSKLNRLYYIHERLHMSNALEGLCVFCCLKSLTLFQCINLTVPVHICRTQTVNDHFRKEASMLQEAIRANNEKKSSYFDGEEQRKIDTLKNEVYYKVFMSLHCLTKEEVPSSKINSLLILLEDASINC